MTINTDGLNPGQIIWLIEEADDGVTIRMDRIVSIGRDLKGAFIYTSANIEMRSPHDYHLTLDGACKAAAEFMRSLPGGVKR